MIVCIFCSNSEAPSSSGQEVKANESGIGFSFGPAPGEKEEGPALAVSYNIIWLHAQSVIQNWKWLEFIRKGVDNVGGRRMTSLRSASPLPLPDHHGITFRVYCC